MSNRQNHFPSSHNPCSDEISNNHNIQHVYHMKGGTSLSCRNHQSYVQEMKDITRHNTLWYWLIMVNMSYLRLLIYVLESPCNPLECHDEASCVRTEEGGFECVCYISQYTETEIEDASHCDQGRNFSYKYVCLLIIQGCIIDFKMWWVLGYLIFIWYRK